MGETSRPFWDRMGEHVDLLKRLDDASPLYKHWREVHPTHIGPPNFTFQVVGTYKTSLERQLREALLIQNDKSDYPMNSKSEFGFNAIVQLSATEESASPKRKKRTIQPLGSQIERETGRGRDIVQGVQTRPQTHQECDQSARNSTSARPSARLKSAKNGSRYPHRNGIESQAQDL